MDQASSNEFRTRKTKRVDIKRVAAHDCERLCRKITVSGPGFVSDRSLSLIDQKIVIMLYFWNVIEFNFLHSQLHIASPALFL